MKSEYIDVRGYWGVAIGYDLSPLDEYRVRETLMGLGLRGEDLEEAIDILFYQKNTGMCITLPEEKMSLVYIGEQTSEEQFWDTLEHEFYHVAVSICSYYGADHKGEDGAWTIGYLTRKAVKQIGEPCHDN